MQTSQANKSTQQIHVIGKLIRLHYKAGDPYVQLVFKTSRGPMLALSRNARMVKSLIVGKTYSVRGEKHSSGNKTYITNPLATRTIMQPFTMRKKASLAFGLASMAVVGTFLTASALHSETSGSAASTQQNTTTSAQNSTSSDTTNEVTGSSTINTPAAVQPTTSAPVSTTKKPTVPTKAPQTTPPANTNPATPVPTETLPEQLPPLTETPPAATNPEPQPEETPPPTPTEP